MKDKLTELGRAERYPQNAHGDGTKGSRREFNHLSFQTIFKRSHACVSDINPCFLVGVVFLKFFFVGEQVGWGGVTWGLGPGLSMPVITLWSALARTHARRRMVVAVFAAREKCV